MTVLNGMFSVKCFPPFESRLRYDGLVVELLYLTFIQVNRSLRLRSGVKRNFHLRHDQYAHTWQVKITYTCTIGQKSTPGELK